MSGSPKNDLPDLIALIAVLGAGVTFIALGVTPGSLGTVCAALAALFLAWSNRKNRWRS